MGAKKQKRETLAGRIKRADISDLTRRLNHTRWLYGNVPYPHICPACGRGTGEGGCDRGCGQRIRQLIAAIETALSGVHGAITDLEDALSPNGMIIDVSGEE